jgi:hypothetical protein
MGRFKSDRNVLQFLQEIHRKVRFELGGHMVMDCEGNFMSRKFHGGNSDDGNIT